MDTSLDPVELLGGPKRIAESVRRAVGDTSAPQTSAIEWLGSLTCRELLTIFYTRAIALTDAIPGGDDVAERWWKATGRSPLPQGPGMPPHVVRGALLRWAALDQLCKKASESPEQAERLERFRQLILEASR